MAGLFLTEIGVGAAVACAAVNYWVMTPRVKAAQSLLVDRFGAFARADKADPLYLRFDSLHQISTTLFLAGFVAAMVGLVCMTQFRRRGAAGVA